MGAFAESPESIRIVPEGGNSMNYGDDGDTSDRKPTPGPDPDGIAAPTGWLDALNAYLERAMKADLDTGC